MRRLSLLIRGPGILLLLLGLGLAGKAVAHPGSHRVTPTALSKPFIVHINSQSATTDRTTGVSARVSGGRLLVQRVALPVTVGSRVTLLIEVSMRIAARTAQPVDPINFYALATSGLTYGAEPRVSGVPGLQRQLVAPGAVVMGWVGFSLPETPERLLMIWNDHNRLLPPARLATASIVRTGTK